MQFTFKILSAFCLLLLCMAILLFAIAIYLYPGGNPVVQDTLSFDFSKNYLCNLFNDHGINTLPNQGKYFALMATASLSLSFAITFYLFPAILSLKRVTQYWVQGLGSSSMVIGFFIFTPFHDTVINVAGTLGLISLLIILYHLLQQKKYLNLLLVMMAILSSGITYFIYYSGVWFGSLAIMQKLSLFMFMIWLGHSHMVLPKKNRAPKLVNS